MENVKAGSLKFICALVKNLVNSCGNQKQMSDWICCLWEQNPIHGFNLLYI